jgi:hypothetical protein
MWKVETLDSRSKLRADRGSESRGNEPMASPAHKVNILRNKMAHITTKGEPLSGELPISRTEKPHLKLRMKNHEASPSNKLYVNSENNSPGGISQTKRYLFAGKKENCLENTPRNNTTMTPSNGSRSHFRPFELDNSTNKHSITKSFDKRSQLSKEAAVEKKNEEKLTFASFEFDSPSIKSFRDECSPTKPHSGYNTDSTVEAKHKIAKDLKRMEVASNSNSRKVLRPTQQESLISILDKLCNPEGRSRSAKKDGGPFTELAKMTAILKLPTVTRSISCRANQSLERSIESRKARSIDRQRVFPELNLALVSSPNQTLHTEQQPNTFSSQPHRNSLRMYRDHDSPIRRKTLINQLKEFQNDHLGDSQILKTLPPPAHLEDITIVKPEESSEMGNGRKSGPNSEGTKSIRNSRLILRRKQDTPHKSFPFTADQTSSFAKENEVSSVMSRKATNLFFQDIGESSLLQQDFPTLKDIHLQERQSILESGTVISKTPTTLSENHALLLRPEPIEGTGTRKSHFSNLVNKNKVEASLNDSIQASFESSVKQDQSTLQKVKKPIEIISRKELVALTSQLNKKRTSPDKKSQEKKSGLAEQTPSRRQDNFKLDFFDVFHPCFQLEKFKYLTFSKNITCERSLKLFIKEIKMDVDVIKQISYKTKEPCPTKVILTDIDPSTYLH